MKILVVCSEVFNFTPNTNLFDACFINHLIGKNDLSVICDYHDKYYNQMAQGSADIKGVEIFPYSQRGKIRVTIKKLLRRSRCRTGDIGAHKDGSNSIKQSRLKRILNGSKILYLNIFHPAFRNDSRWIRNSSVFKSDTHFDVLVSISFPPASHQIAYNLLNKKHIKCNSWIQIWQEPWYRYKNPGDFKQTAIINHYEKKLIKECDYAFFNSGFVMDMYQKKYKDESGKFFEFDLIAEPIPMYKQLESKKEFVVGYFGTYHSSVRNIIPFYNAVRSLGIKSQIVGVSNLQLNNTDKINIINKLVPYEECLVFERNVHCLVVIANFRSNVLPGKSFYYCGTQKPILYILDGSWNTKSFVKKKFGNYPNVYLCENNEKDISQTIQIIINDLQERKQYPLVEDFSSRSIIKKIGKAANIEW